MRHLNVGCGQHPASGWINYDNSYCVKIARLPVWLFILKTLHVLNKNQIQFVNVAKEFDIKWADIRFKIPEKSESVDALYMSHVLENMYQAETRLFLAEALRVLRPGGILRVCAMDIGQIIDRYHENSKADDLMKVFFSTREKRPTIIQNFQNILVGDRNRKWYYDSSSLVQLLTSAGFENAVEVKPGYTAIETPGELNLFEQIEESMYVEARKAKAKN